MIKRIKTIIQENRIYHKKTRLMLQEQEWANVYHDSIRGFEAIERLPLNIGRWAGGYAFFYVLHRILKDYKPDTILEFGLGESSKFVSTYITHYLPNTQHQIIEEDLSWEKTFNNQFQLHENSKITLCPLEEKKNKGFVCNHYSGLKEVVKTTFNLYIIDGPNGSKRYSRYDIMYIVSLLKTTDEFIIMFDDFDRKGEQDTFEDLKLYFNSRSIDFVFRDYKGAKTLRVIASIGYRYVMSL
ncbi:hypothetical protein [Formosa algae]|uniref:Methyltransferase n=1 Tax=Formosa algae TaxID=225843 RepID=A0A9X0YLQ5_9FLAO|nr:hypothetical protein [Formosa algae]MBP1841350.1 hypothetical protein [Formosa algae]MDQ0336728.1 hypothetical protein [Formosa algae]OEI80366.1 hypothetical protein AST99_09640 [Formosa algae]